VSIPGQRATPPARALLVPAALFAGYVAVALARLALLPGLGFWDTGEFQVVGPLLGTAHPTGFPLYVLLGWAASALMAPLGEPAFRMNLLSALLVGGATALAVVLVSSLTGHLWIALASGLVLAAVPIVWIIGTHADPHALHLLLVTLLVILLVGWGDRVGGKGRRASGSAGHPGGRRTADRWLAAAAAVYGLSLANHQLTLLLTPGVGLYVLATDASVLRRPRFVAGLAALVVGLPLLLYLELPLRAGLFRAPLVYGHPERLDGFLYVIVAQQFFGSVSGPFADLPGKVLDLVRLGLDQFGILAAAVPLGFVVALNRAPRYALLSGLSFLITVWFASSYDNGDIARYYLVPALFALTWVALLASAVVERLRGLVRADVLDAPRGVMMDPRRQSWFGTPGLMAFVLEILVAGALVVPTVAALPDRTRDVDESRDHTAGDWAHRAMQLMEPNAVVVSWWSYSTALWYVQLIEGQRPDVWIVDDRTRLDQNLGDITTVIDAQLGHRPVYVIARSDNGTLARIQAGYDVQEFTMPTEQSVLMILGRKVP
jgi:hypothetical protein